MEPAILDSLKAQLEDKGWRLRFPDPLEGEYQHDYAVRYQGHIVLAMLLGLLAIVGSGVGDWLFMRDILYRLWMVRLLIATPMFALLLLARQRKFLPYTQPLISASACVGLLGVLSFSHLARDPITHYYGSGIILVMLLVFVLSRQQFYWGLLTAALMDVMMNAFLVLVDHADWEMMIVRNFIFFVSTLFALTGAFLIERSLRQNYLQARLLDFGNRGLEEANIRLHYLTAIDGLTNIANRRSLDTTLRTEWQRALRKKEQLTLLMIDVDHFKLYNDTYGHQAGDLCLQEVASKLKPFARRPGDLAARYGGEEFAVVLTATSPEDAVHIGETIRNEILRLSIPHRHSQHGTVTASIGVAVMVPNNQLSPDDLYQAADEALYRAKRGGRNRVILSIQEGKPT